MGGVALSSILPRKEILTYKGRLTMSAFTDKEIEYLLSQRLGRLATVRPDGKPQVAPVGFRYNAELDVINVAGRYPSQTKKFPKSLKNPHVSPVIADELPPC